MYSDLWTEGSKSDMYVYAYYEGEKIPDVTELRLKDGSATVTVLALSDKFPDWFRSIPEKGTLELRMDNVWLPLTKLYMVKPKVVGIKSDVDDITEISIRFD